MKKLFLLFAVYILFMMTVASLKVSAQLPSNDIHNINNYVLFAYDQLSFKGGNQQGGTGYVVGNIGVNNPAATNNTISLEIGTSGFAFINDGYVAVGDHVRGDKGGSFYDLQANKRAKNFKAAIRNNWVNQINLPIIAPENLPVFPFTPNRFLTNTAPDKVINKNTTYTFTTSPWRDVRIKDHAIVNFGPGTFDLRNLDIGKFVTINLDEKTILQIDQTFQTNNDLQLWTNSLGAFAKIFVGAYGVNVNTTDAVNFSNCSNIQLVDFFSPTGCLDIGNQNFLIGHFWAQRITGGINNNVFCFPWVCCPESPVSQVSSVNPDENQEVQISVFPNPAKESFTLQINNSTNQGSILTLQDMTGKVIMHTAIQLQEGVNTYPVSIAGIAQGIYIVKLQTGTGIGLKKLIIR